VSGSGDPDDRHIFRPELPRRHVALAAVFLSGILFAVMSVMTKMSHLEAFVGRPIPAAQVVLVRFSFGFLALLPLHGRRGIDVLGRDRKRLFFRGIWGGFAVYFFFLSIQQTSLAHALLLNYSSIVFAPLFAWIFLHERIGNRTSIALLVAILGIGLVTIQTNIRGALNLGDLFGLISGILAGASITEIRRLRQSESPYTVFFYLCLVGLPISLAACIFSPPIWPTPAGWLVLSVMGVCSIFAQLLLTFCYKYLRAVEGSLISMTQLLYNTFAGAVLFGEVLTTRSLVGGTLILAAAIWLATCSKAPKEA
jgi:drug/metabolite transporter (DMT)-like permease